MAQLAGALVLLILSHAIPSAPKVRERLLSTFGRAGFYAGYSAISLLTLALVIVAYRDAPWVWLYTPPAGARWLAVLLMPLAVFLVVGRLTTSPGPEPAGVYRITAVPGSLGILLWASLHLLNLGAAHQVLLFGAFAAIALLALIKNLRQAPPAFRRIGAVTFLAMVTERERLVWREIGWWRLVVALAGYGLLLGLHPLVIGLDPLAGLG